jgi:RNA polymerase sigma-70 factor (ECF subfamily)
MPEDADERALVLAAQSGDEAAFAVLIRSRQALVAAVVASRVKERSDVEDLVQEVFLRAWTRLSGLQDPDRFGGWLARIAVNAALDHRRRRRVRPQAASLGDDVPEPAGRDAPADHDLIVAEEHGRVLVALDALDPKSRRAVLLRFHEGLAVKDIAVLLGDSPPAVAMRLTRALRTLRERLP